MGKRSRDVSLTPSDSSSTLHSESLPPENEDDRVTKVAALDAQTSTTGTSITMKCNLPPHETTLAFTSIEAFELHYAKDHTNRCSSCSRNLPSAHFLALHIDENHNPVREALAAQGEKTYACFVEDCDRKCSTPQKRRLHVIDKHNFPKFYNFRIVDQGIDNATSLLREGRRRRVSTVTADTSVRLLHHRRTFVGSDSSNDNNNYNDDRDPYGNTEGRSHQKHTAEHFETKSVDQDNDAMQDLERSLSALKFVPRSVQSRQHRDRTEPET